MASPQLLQASFARGVKRDFPRDQMPGGSAWDLVDFLIHREAALVERGGYEHASDDIAAVTATASYVIGGIYARFAAGVKNLAIDEDGRLYEIAANGDVTDIGAAVVVAQNPVFHRDLVIIPSSDGTTAPDSYDGTTLGALGGSPPAGIYAVVYKDRTWLANSDANPERLWASDPGDPAGWDTTNTYFDFSFPVTGLAAIRNAILVFGEARTASLRGSTPPPGSDMVKDDPLFEVGCTDARSIAPWQDRVIFANPEGVYVTDGAAVDNLSARCGMSSYWQDLLAGYDSAWTLVGGILQDHYLLFVMDGATFVDAAMIDLHRYTWIRHSNLDARSCWVAQAAADELYFGRRGAARVGSLSSILAPAAAVKNDADGDAVAAVAETPFYQGRPGMKGWRHVYVGYDLRDVATDNPTLSISVIKTPEATSYAAVGSALTETTKKESKRLALGFGSEGIALKLTRANAASAARIWAIEADVHAREPSRRAA